MTRTISIALVTRNGMATLPAVLEAIAGQDIADEVELVAVDSSSDDGTFELLERRAARVLQIDPADFNHGTTRNQAIELASGDLVVLLVQDAVPDGPGWLRALTRPFADPTVAGSYARQLPAAGASRLARWNLERWIASAPEPRRSQIDDRKAWNKLPPTDRFLSCVFDNVCSCVRRTVWHQHPFPATIIAEDLMWSREVLLAGHAISFAADAAVRHSHERGAHYELHRTYLVHERLHQLFGLRTIGTRQALLRAWIASLREHLKVISTGNGPRPGGLQVFRALSLALAWPLGQYLGGKAAAEGRPLLRTNRI